MRKSECGMRNRGGWKLECGTGEGESWETDVRFYFYSINYSTLSTNQPYIPVRRNP
jgi:hypothetical protein